MKSRAQTTPRTLKLLRERGYTAEKVEQRIQAFTRDLFNCLDVIAMGHGTIIGVQVTTTSNRASRRAKMLAEPMMRTWLENGGKLFVHGWAKKGARGKRKLWCLHEEEITLADMPHATVATRMEQGFAALGLLPDGDPGHGLL